MLTSESKGSPAHRAARRRVARLGLAGAAAAALLAGAAVPAAQAIDPGEWTFDAELGVGKFTLSYGVAVDPSNGDFYVTDPGNDRLLKFNSKGEELAKRGETGDGYGNFNGIHGVAVDASGFVYVADTDNNLIQKFDSDLNWAGQWGGTGSANGEFSSPLDVAVDGTGSVYVADTLNFRVQKFDSDGTWKDKWGTQGQGDGQFDQPRALTVSSGGVVLVADTNNDRVSAFTDKGVFQGSFGSSGTEAGKFDTPADIVTDASGNIFVADIGNDRVQKFNGAGTPVALWATPNSSQGIALDALTGRTYVADGASGVTSYREASSPSITTGLKATGTVGKVYTSKLTASGFPAPVFSVLSESLPKGLELVEDTVTGVKRKTGTYQVTMQADNSVGDPVSKEYQVTFNRAASVLKTSWSTKYPKVKKTKIVAKLRISAPGTTGLSRTGTMKIYYGGKYIKSVKVYPSYKGVVTVKLPVFHKKGKKKIVVKYQGNSQLTSSTYVKYVTAK